VDEVLARYRSGDRHALSRLLTFASRGESLPAIRAAVEQQTDQGRVVAITGSGGVGKSSLIGELAAHLRQQSISVAVLACDPESPLTGGALLGDRVRMSRLRDQRPGVSGQTGRLEADAMEADDGLFIRSLATPGGQQAIAENLDLMIDLLIGFGFQVVLLETVGAGQGDTAVHELADVLVLLVQPESGDDLQWEKAGLFEVADVIAVNKADLPGADRVAAQVQMQLALPGSPSVAVVKTSAAKHEGVDALWKAIAALPGRRGPVCGGPHLLQLAQQRLADRFRRERERLEPLLARWQRRELDDDQAVEELLRLIARPESRPQ
jgi:LAO/AO transport system ATPase